MKITSPKELQKFLDQHGLAAKKSASQNFLIDGNIVNKIITEARLSPEDLVIEIGPGPGALTESILEAGSRVIAIEKDPELGPLLTRFSTRESDLLVFIDDFLKFPLEETLLKHLLPNQKAKVIANLPYHITTPILEKLLPLHHVISDLVLMVQKEVAHRFVAQPKTKDYSSFTLFLQFFGKARYCFTIEPSCFLPRPSVQSAVVHLTLHEPPKLDQSTFFDLTQTAFRQRRKMLRSSLKEKFSSKLIEDSLSSLDINPLARPEELSLREFIAFYYKLYSDA